MDYEKKYKETIERARKLQENSNGMILKKWLWNIFPELKESEDEEVRKDIKQHFLYLDDSFPDKAKWLAWLEKQKVLTTEEDLQGKEDVLWCIKQAKKYAKNENEMGTCWFAEKWLEKQGEQNLIMAKSPQLGFGEQTPAWSEEDEEYLQRAIKATKEVYPITSDWLKSLKQRIKL